MGIKKSVIISYTAVTYQVYILRIKSPLIFLIFIFKSFFRLNFHTSVISKEGAAFFNGPGRHKCQIRPCIKVHGGCGCKGPHTVHTATALGSGRVASPTLGRLYTGKSPGTHFMGGLMDPRTIWTLSSEEKSPPLRHPGLNQGRPAMYSI